MITTGHVAILKVSKEPVFVLDVTENQVTVRRPVQTQDGVVHVTNTFGLNELQTKEQAIEDEIHEALLFQAKRTAAEATYNKPAKPETFLN